MTGSGHDDARSSTDNGRLVPGVGPLGVWLILISLGIPFLVVIGSYFILRGYADTWAPHEFDGTPTVLWISTISILVVSVFCHGSVRAIRADAVDRTKVALLGATFSVVVFTLCQVIAWDEMRVAFIDLGPDLRQYKVGFFLLTGFHALHVVGGMVLQGFVLTQFYRSRYWSLYHPGIRYAAWYWHFLAALWIVIFATLLWGG